MLSKKDEKKIFIRRAFILCTIKFLFITIAVARLVYLQIFKASHYQLLSDKNRIVEKQLLPIRGEILDARGKVLAKNIYSYTAILDLLEIPQKDQKNVITMLKDTIQLDVKTINLLNNLPQKINKINRYILLQENLDWTALSRFYIASSEIPGIVIEKTRSRQYLYPCEFSHIIGYIGAPSREDFNLTGNTTLLLPMAKIGKIGIEKQYDDLLFGRSGIQHVEVNSTRQFVREIDCIPAKCGQDIKLTVDLNLQLAVYKLMSQHKSGACVVMNIQTGAILAFVSYPGYDINLFTRRLDPEVLKDLYANPYKPMLNKVSCGLYAPGSTFKMITALAALKHGVINKYTKFHCSGVYDLGRAKFHCWRWKTGGHGYMSLRESLAQSCDTFYYNIAKKIKPESIAETANDFGLGILTGIDLPDEKVGLIPTAKWKTSRKHGQWTIGDTFNMSIGQGYVLTTILQLAKMTAMLANDQSNITPHVVPINKQKFAERHQYDKDHIFLILSGMRDVVNDPRGTAYNHMSHDSAWIAGKTGSSQVCRITKNQRKLGLTKFDDYWKKENALFVAYFPIDNPKYVVAIVVEHGGSGASVAAPLAEQIIKETVDILH
jgi:penicillin-binding protein 2